MSVAAKQVGRHSFGEYLALEERAECRHEFHDGEIFAMAGGSPMHALIALNIGAELRQRIADGGCKVFGGDLRIGIPKRRSILYSDTTVVCEDLEYYPDDPTQTTVVNPKLIVEVLSPSTEAYNRGKKFDLYRSLTSLEEYVLVWQTSPRIEVYRVAPQGEIGFDNAAGLDASVKLRSIGIELPLRPVYKGVVFPPTKDDEAERTG